MRGVPDRFEWLGFRINVPDWMSREFRADGMIVAIARCDDLVDITVVVEEMADDVCAEFSALEKLSPRPCSGDSLRSGAGADQRGLLEVDWRRP